MRNKHSSRKHPPEKLPTNAAHIPPAGPDVLHELIPIVLESNAGVGPLWTIRHTLQQWCVQKRIEVYVVFRLEIEPYNGPEPIAFLFAAPEDENYRAVYQEGPNAEDVRQLAEAVLQGVRNALQERADQGIQMTNLLIGLTELGVHLTDSRPGSYRYWATKMMRSFLEPDNLVVFAG